MTNVQVSVRVRPFNDREIANGDTLVVFMSNNETIIYDPVIINRSIRRKISSNLIIVIGHLMGKIISFIADPKTGIFVKDTPLSKYADQKMIFDDLVG